MARKRVSARRPSSAASTPAPTSTSVPSSSGRVSARRVSARPSARPAPQPAFVEQTAPAAKRPGVMAPAEVKATTAAPRRPRGARPGQAGTVKIQDRFGNDIPAMWYARNKGRGSFTKFTREREDRQKEAEQYPGWGDLPRDYDTGYPLPANLCGYDEALWPKDYWGKDEGALERGAKAQGRAAVLRKVDGKLRPVRISPQVCVSMHAKAQRKGLREFEKDPTKLQIRAQPRRGTKGWAYYYLSEQAKDPLIARYMTAQARAASESAWSYKDALDEETGAAYEAYMSEPVRYWSGEPGRRTSRSFKTKEEAVCGLFEKLKKFDDGNGDWADRSRRPDLRVFKTGPNDPKAEGGRYDDVECISTNVDEDGDPLARAEWVTSGDLDGRVWCDGIGDESAGEFAANHKCSVGQRLGRLRRRRRTSTRKRRAPRRRR